jgi:hypothetical protein
VGKKSSDKENTRPSTNTNDSLSFCMAGAQYNILAVAVLVDFLGRLPDGVGVGQGVEVGEKAEPLTHVLMRDSTDIYRAAITVLVCSMTWLKMCMIKVLLFVTVVSKDCFGLISDDRFDWGSIKFEFELRL